MNKRPWSYTRLTSWYNSGKRTHFTSNHRKEVIFPLNLNGIHSELLIAFSKTKLLLVPYPFNLRRTKLFWLDCIMLFWLDCIMKVKTPCFILKIVYLFSLKKCFYLFTTYLLHRKCLSCSLLVLLSVLGRVWYIEGIE